MFDLLIRNAALPDGRAGVDIGVRSGRIAALEPALAAEAGEVIDAGASSSRRPSSIRISTWTRRSRSGGRG